jgi:hypothetical protein
VNKKCHSKIADQAALADQERCTRLFALTVEKKQKFLSNQLKEGLFTAEIVIQSMPVLEDTR